MIYVILAHNQPEQLKQLIKKLQFEESCFVIHIDKNCDIKPFQISLLTISNCFFTPKRYASQWGSFALVEATLHAFDYIRQELKYRQRVVLLSGSDYPIKENIYIKKFLGSHKNTIFMEYDAIPRKIWHNGGRNRFPMYESISKQITFYGGSQWFSIPYKMIDIIFLYLAQNPDFLKYFRHVKIPDESFFQTLFLNCGNDYVLKNLKNKNLHFVKWDKPYEHPRILTMKDFMSLKKSKNLFARKFDFVVSNNLQKQIF